MDRNAPWPVSEELSTDECWISKLMILKTAVYYIGRMCLDRGEDGLPFPEPYSRESGYYRTKEEAERALAEGFIERDCVENNLAYTNGSLSRTAR